MKQKFYFFKQGAEMPLVFLLLFLIIIISHNNYNSHNNLRNIIAIFDVNKCFGQFFAYIY